MIYKTKENRELEITHNSIVNGIRYYLVFENRFAKNIISENQLKKFISNGDLIKL